MLDAGIVSDYITCIGRDFGLSDDQCYYGRASLDRKKDGDLGEAD